MTYGELNRFYDEEYVESRIMYTLDDFGYSAPIRMNHPPEQPTAVCLIFVRVRSDPENIRVAFGIDYNDEYLNREDLREAAEPDANSPYDSVMTFDYKMIKEFSNGEIKSLDQLLD